MRFNAISHLAAVLFVGLVVTGAVQAVVLLAFGWQLETAHASPHGPIAFALLIVVAIWLWWAEHECRTPHVQRGGFARVIDCRNGRTL